MTILKKINAAQSAVELIGYREDALALTPEESRLAIEAIQTKFEELRHQPTRPLPRTLDRRKSLKSMFGSHKQTSESCDTELDKAPTPGTGDEIITPRNLAHRKAWESRP